MLVGCDSLSLVELDADVLDADFLDDRASADGDEHQIRVDGLAVAEVDGEVRAVVVDLRALLLEVEGDPAAAELLRQLLGRVLVLLRN